jgi:lipopolysaccharide/colanic/teichoic acid biosynthesis glycosyltransferase
MAVSEDHALNRSAEYRARDGEDEVEGLRTARDRSLAPPLSLEPPLEPLSSWSRSNSKRIFDCVCVLLSLPLLAPVLLAIGLAVRLTSSGPVFFLQKRMGRFGRTFTILKFRSMIDTTDKKRHAVTTTENQQFTSIGLFLRRWKLDELPQLLNVLWGDMSLVGARPKMLEHAIFDLRSRPGVTGAATIAFAHEAAVLANVPDDHLENYYFTVVLPAKRRLDVEYMAHATFLSDLGILFNTLLRRWDSSAMESALSTGALEATDETLYAWKSAAHILADTSARTPIPTGMNRPASAEQAEAS